MQDNGGETRRQNMTKVLFPGVKRPGREADHVKLVPRSRMRGSIHSPNMS